MKGALIQVLLVEDNPGDARLILEHLGAGAAGFTVETVDTLEKAVERCSRPGVDAVLLDLGLPDSIGLDTLKVMRTRVPELPVLVLTGLDDEKTAVKAVLAGAQDYLTKGEADGAVISRALRYAIARKQVEEKLKLNEARLAAAQAVAKIGSWETNLLNYKTVWSEETYRIFGMAADSFVPTHQDFMAFVYPEDRAKVEAAFTGSFDKHQANLIEHRILTSSGLLKVVEERWRIVFDDQSRPILAMGTCQDITERKQAEAELLKMQELQSLGTLAGGIAHDFNNILLGLFGNLSIAMDDLSKDHPSYAPLEEAEKSMNRAIRLTKQLLTFSKGGAPVKENLILGTMVEEVARFDLTGSNVSLVYRQAKDLWPVDADKGQFQQVVSNLVINARQAMPKGGHLYITLENAEITQASVPALSPRRYVKVSVRDEGAGIEAKLLTQIFDPYFTTKQTGSGLGLATVWSIIQKHGGHIGVESELGKGTTFTLYLPASTSPLPAELKPSVAESPEPSRHAKILVMDDEKMVCDLASRMLSRCGYSVSTAPGGQEALALCKQALEAGAPFDVVIMDLTIPGGIGGLEAVTDLLALDPRVRAIVSSGYADDPVIANPAAYGFKGTVAKPYTATALREAVAQALEKG